MDLSIISNNSDNSVDSISTIQNTTLNQSTISSRSNQSNKSYTSSGTIQGIEECSICFHPLLTEVAYLECNHMFHFNCLSKWQQKKKTQNIICPICQQNSIIKAISSANEFEDISHVLQENKEQKDKRLMANNRYIKFPGIDDMDHSVVCCNIL
jgi:hypothetical protein